MSKTKYIEQDFDIESIISNAGSVTNIGVLTIAIKDAIKKSFSVPAAVAIFSTGIVVEIAKMIANNNGYKTLTIKTKLVWVEDFMTEDGTVFTGYLPSKTTYELN